MNRVKGAKGGESSRKAIESPDSLFSIAHARIVDLISEGEIEGFASGETNFLRDIFLDETPIENPDGSRNFNSFQVEARMGSQSQSHIPGFPAVENEISVGVELRADTPWSRSISNTALSAVRVRLATGSLTKSNPDNGDITGTTVQYAIDVATDGGPFQEVMRSAFTGKTTSSYERSHRIDLPPATGAGWIIRVRRLTADNSSIYIQDETFVRSITEIIDGKFRYPMSAVVGIQIDASQFQSIPTRAFRMKGRRIRVPVNYDPVTRSYTGPWNGTFKIAYSDNPAWVYYDMATHKRYGLGRQVADLEINRYALYQIAQYCDEMVPDGFGGTEPRMTCNLYLQKAEDAWKVMTDLASIFRGMSYWAGGSIVAVSDRPTDPVYTYTNANVVEGIFSYQSSGRRARHTAVVVGYNDMTDFGKMKFDYYDDPELIARFGFQMTEVVALGCSSRGQAQRVAKWILLTERYLTNTCSWSVGLDGTFAFPGQIVRVADQYRAGRRTGGRVSSGTAGSVVLDRVPSPAPAPGDTLVVNLPSGASESRVISTVIGNTVNVATPFSETPAAETVWAVESSSLTSQLYRVISVTPLEGSNGYEMSGLQHNPELFDAVDLGEPISVPATSLINSPFQVRPNEVTVTSVERAGVSVAMPLLTATWDAPEGAVRYQVQWQKDEGEWSPVQIVHGTTSDFQNPFPGSYVVKVSAINVLGVVSTPRYSESFLLADQTLLPGFAADLADQVADALLAAENAEAAADGAIEMFWQPSPPVIEPSASWVAREGDFWVDTDDGNSMWRATSGVWVSASDNRMALALAAAATAQSTADGKVKTFFQDTTPTATGIGDLWYAPTTKVMKRWNGTDWNQTVLDMAAIESAIADALSEAENATAIADGAIVSFWASTAPPIGPGTGEAKEGDIWFHTGQGNRIYRVVSGVWVDAQDDDLANALSQAATASAAAAAAASAAASAASAAASANAKLAAIAADNILSVDEKPRVILDRQVIMDEKSGIEAQATAYGITTELTNYQNAVTALNTYLATLTTPVLWSDLSADTQLLTTS